MNNEQIIALLAADMQDEHAAIMQYLTQAYAIGEGDLACEMEAISREEMQHFRWLADRITALGGKPAMQRGKVVFGGPVVAEMLGADIAAEEHAIAQYRQHIAAIGEPAITIWLERIISDEEAHHAKFQGLQAEQDPALQVRMELTPADAQQAGFLQRDTTHEYTVVLQYLAHAFTTPHCEVEHEMEYAAVEEMRHMGWLAEKMEGLGARAEMTHDPLVLPDDTAAMLEADIDVEQRVAAEYRRQAGESPEKLAALYQRLAREEDHHVYIFSGLLEEVSQEEAPPAQPGFTVGSLLNQEQK